MSCRRLAVCTVTILSPCTVETTVSARRARTRVYEQCLEPLQIVSQPIQRARRRTLALMGIGALLCVIALIVVISEGNGHKRNNPPAAHVTRPAPERAGVGTPPLRGIPAGRWTAMRSDPVARGEVSAARIGRAVYVVGGFDASGRTTAMVQRLDLATGRWVTVAPLPMALNHMSALSYGGQLYVVGGYASPGDTSTQAVRGFWRFDPARERWSAMPAAPIARAAAGVAVLGHRLYVAGGRNDASTALSSVAIFDFTTGRWSLGPRLLRAREHVAAVSGGDAIWVLGGRALGQGTFTDVERLLPRSRLWELRRPMPVARAGFAAVSVGGGILTVGGEDGDHTVGEVDRLDLRTGRWTRLPPLPVARHGLGVVADGPLVFAIDGGPHAGLTVSGLVSRLRLS